MCCKKKMCVFIQRYNDEDKLQITSHYGILVFQLMWGFTSACRLIAWAEKDANIERKRSVLCTEWCCLQCPSPWNCFEMSMSSLDTVIWLDRRRYGTDLHNILLLVWEKRTWNGGAENEVLWTEENRGCIACRGIFLPEPRRQNWPNRKCWRVGIFPRFYFLKFTKLCILKVTLYI